MARIRWKIGETTRQETSQLAANSRGSNPSNLGSFVVFCTKGLILTAWKKGRGLGYHMCLERFFT